MKLRLLVIAALLGTLRASGADAPLTPAETAMLESIDALPTAAQIDFATQPAAGRDRLLAIATDGAVTGDLGIQIRAIRLLPLYCPPEDCSGTQIHDTLLSLVQGYVTALRQAAPAGLSPQDVLRLRAAVEALGATRSGLDTDVDALTSDPSLLDHPSRDVRFTVARALRDLGSCKAVTPLQVRSPKETTVPQVQQAILNALQSLHAVQLCPL